MQASKASIAITDAKTARFLGLLVGPRGTGDPRSASSARPWKVTSYTAAVTAAGEVCGTNHMGTLESYGRAAFELLPQCYQIPQIHNAALLQRASRTARGCIMWGAVWGRNV